MSTNENDKKDTSTSINTQNNSKPSQKAICIEITKNPWFWITIILLIIFLAVITIFIIYYFLKFKIFYKF
jgi:hypothetical protein